MRKINLGKTDLIVSNICLGTMTYGEQTSEPDAFDQMDYALSNGINFFDTAEIYAIPPRPETHGATEAIIGNWMMARKARDKIILATKVCGRSGANWLRLAGETCRVIESQIDYAIEQSLRRLQTDYIDLYQIHWPDRLIGNFGTFTHREIAEYTPFEEVLSIMDKHIKKGNIRHIGVSNETPWGVMRYIAESEKNGLPRIATIQNCYNLVNRSFEPFNSETCTEEGVSLLAYSPLGQGYLTGKYLNGARPIGSRTQLFDRGDRYETPSAEIMIEKYVNTAARFGLSPIELALKFCDTRPFLASTIIGATNMDQLKTIINAFNAEWSDDIENAVNLLHMSCPNPVV